MGEGIWAADIRREAHDQNREESLGSSGVDFSSAAEKMRMLEQALHHFACPHGVTWRSYPVETAEAGQKALDALLSPGAPPSYGDSLQEVCTLADHPNEASEVRHGGILMPCEIDGERAFVVSWVIDAVARFFWL